MKARSLKLSKYLEDALTEFASARGTSSSAVVREALEQYLGTAADGTRKDAGSFAAAASELAGCVTGPADLSCSTRHMAAYGQPASARRR